jgi:hypothetical protein
LEDEPKKSWKPKIFIIVFFILGWGIMIGLSLAEEYIKFDIGTKC